MTLYPGIRNSVPTTMDAAFTIGDTTVSVVTTTDVAPDAPNIIVFGDSTDAVAYTYSGKTSTSLTGLVLLEGTAKNWDSGTVVWRPFTNYDWSQAIAEIESVKILSYLNM